MIDFLLSYPFISYTLVTTAISGVVVLIVIKLFRLRNPVLLFRLYLIPLVMPFIVAAVAAVWRPPTAAVDYRIAGPLEGLFHVGALLWNRQAIPLTYILCLLPFIYFSIRFALSLAVDRRLLHRAMRVSGRNDTEIHLIRLVTKQSQRLKIRPPRLYIVDSQRPTAFVFGFRRCGLVISQNLLTGLDGKGLEALISHELTHLARRDTMVMWLMLAVKSLTFYDPTVHLFFHLLRRAREQACDLETVNLTGRPLALAGALYQVYQLSRRAAPGPRFYYYNPSNAAFFSGSSLSRRLQQLIERHQKGPAPAGRRGREAAGTVVIAVLLFSLYLLACLPPLLPVKCPAWSRHHQGRAAAAYISSPKL